MSVSAVGAALEQAGELKIGQVGIANLRVRTLDVAQLAQEMRERVQRAPKLFARAALIIDFGGLPTLPDAATAGALIDALRESKQHVLVGNKNMVPKPPFFSSNKLNLQLLQIVKILLLHPFVAKIQHIYLGTGR